MRAQDLVEQVPTVTRQTTGAEAARVVAEYRLSAVVVADESGRPIAVIPGSQLFGLVLPRWVRDDRTLVHAYDEKGADEICERLNEATIGDLLDDEKLTASKPPSVLPEDTLLEIASAMDDAHTPMLLVEDKEGTYYGALTMSRVLAAIATAAGQDSDLIRRRLEKDIILRGTPEQSGPTREAP
ncbi:CBS domain-containing protein [Phycicoccus endophyticus]|uniref:CBS domain-containing protein n=1 Tax=Phycicoccus endophyticus TaxID=1690220 RepID=A0A7G9R138_9MICO|nr:CBS domain-containing protein [Phycicoccus endophyticus]NHI20558.1 CBS domain-containing protein [Phycicoccus endophyticus]QNN49313.1 CBS domain-containing protein [Phycicoccus endophyticus]GGL45124.1 histidine kinase [Phycicoccus endophyticus]